MSTAAPPTSRRQLSYPEPSHEPEAINSLQSILDTLNQLVEQSERQIAEEQQAISNEEYQMSRDIDQVQQRIDAVNNETEKLTLDTCALLVRCGEAVLVRHNRLLKESIDRINQVLGKRPIVEDPVFEQLRKDMRGQQEKLFLVRNQLDIDHNQLTTNINLLKDCYDQRKQLMQNRLQRQSSSSNLLKVQESCLQKQLRLQLLMEQQKRVRAEVQRLKQYADPPQTIQRDWSTNSTTAKQSFHPRAAHASDEGVLASKTSATTTDRSFTRIKEYRDD